MSNGKSNGLINGKSGGANGSTGRPADAWVWLRSNTKLILLGINALILLVLIYLLVLQAIFLFQTRSLLASVESMGSDSSPAPAASTAKKEPERRTESGRPERSERRQSAPSAASSPTKAATQPTSPVAVKDAGTFEGWGDFSVEDLMILMAMAGETTASIGSEPQASTATVVAAAAAATQTQPALAPASPTLAATSATVPTQAAMPSSPTTAATDAVASPVAALAVEDSTATVLMPAASAGNSAPAAAGDSSPTASTNNRAGTAAKSSGTMSMEELAANWEMILALEMGLMDKKSTTTASVASAAPRSEPPRSSGSSGSADNRSSRSGRSDSRKSSGSSEEDKRREMLDKLEKRALFGEPRPQPVQPQLEAVFIDRAMISGQWVKVGERFHEWKVAEIGTDRVSLEDNEGNRRELTMHYGDEGGGGGLGPPSSFSRGFGTMGGGGESRGGPVASLSPSSPFMGPDGLPRIPDSVFERLTGPGGPFPGMTREQLLERWRQLREGGGRSREEHRHETRSERPAVSVSAPPPVSPKEKRMREEYNRPPREEPMPRSASIPSPPPAASYSPPAPPSGGGSFQGMSREQIMERIRQMRERGGTGGPPPDRGSMQPPERGPKGGFSGDTSGRGPKGKGKRGRD
ncbi:MAG: hypothetical protein N3D11_07270 [Candidatus Sumerlaeia bacterium]|nr:hypothetical protein [Candidatus Sumerlaeia bacterium]